jgi:hypothetical protein
LLTFAGRLASPTSCPCLALSGLTMQFLLRIIEERFLAARPENTEPTELWDRFFCPTVGGQPTREYIVERCLPRPRDFIYWCNGAVGIAANRRHERVEEEDVLDGERLYSQFALEALLVENGITMDLLKQVLLEFLGESVVLEEDSVKELIERAGVEPAQVDAVLSRLKAVSFLGVETADDRFEFFEDETGAERAEVLARKHSEKTGKQPRYQVHTAFRQYLELVGA